MAEFDYRPVACDRDYRVVVVWKSLAIHQGQQNGVHALKAPLDTLESNWAVLTPNQERHFER